MKTWFTINNFHYRKTIRLLKREVALKSCYLQNNFQEIWFFLYKKPIILLEVVIGRKMFLKNSIWICSLKDSNLLKWHSVTVVFLWIFRKFSKQLFIENLWRAASKIDWLPEKKIIWWSFYMIYDKQWNLHLHLFRQAMQNRTWRFRSCCPFMECVVGQHWWVYTIARVEASHREIQLVICNFSVLTFLVLLQALFGNGHFAFT